MTYEHQMMNVQCDLATGDTNNNHYLVGHRDARHACAELAAAADGEIEALQAELAESEAEVQRLQDAKIKARADCMVAERRLAESEAQRAALVAALKEVEAWREPMDPTIEKELALLHEEMKTCPECKAMANHPVSRGVCAGGKYRHYERTHALYEERDRISDNTTPYQVRRIAENALANQPPSDLVALVKAAAAFREVMPIDGPRGREFADTLDTLLTNQPGFRALIDREGV